MERGPVLRVRGCSRAPREEASGRQLGLGARRAFCIRPARLTRAAENGVDGAAIECRIELARSDVRDDDTQLRQDLARKSRDAHLETLQVVQAADLGVAEHDLRRIRRNRQDMGVEPVAVDVGHHRTGSVHHGAGFVGAQRQKRHVQPLELGGGRRLPVSAVIKLDNRRKHNSHEWFFALCHLMNPDAVFDGPNPVAHLLDAWDPGAMDALMLLVPVTQARSYSRAGDFFLDSDGAPPNRRGDRPSAPFVYSGLQIITPEAFADPPSRVFSTNVIWDRLAARGRLAATGYHGTWVDVGTPEGLAEAGLLLRNGRS